MAKGFFSRLLSGDDPEEDDRQAAEAHEFYQNHLCDGDKGADEMGEFFRDTNTVEQMQQVEEEKRLWWFGVRRN